MIGQLVDRILLRYLMLIGELALFLTLVILGLGALPALMLVYVDLTLLPLTERRSVSTSVALHSTRKTRRDTSIF